jgi:hypothetical protein
VIRSDVKLNARLIKLARNTLASRLSSRSVMLITVYAINIVLLSQCWNNVAWVASADNEIASTLTICFFELTDSTHPKCLLSRSNSAKEI